MTALKLKKNIEVDQSDQLQSEAVEQSSEHTKSINQYFYKVSNHHELFKIGRSYFEDYKIKGIKSFAISSTGYQNSQQKSILGLASFFDHKERVKIGIVSDNLFEGTFKDLIAASELEEVVLAEGMPPLKVYSFYNHFEFLDLRQIVDLVNDKSISFYDEVLDKLVEAYDVVFWDVPELHKVQRNSEKYFPIIMKFENLSIIVSQKLSSAKDIENVKDFFLGYGINLKGLLLENVVEKFKGDDEEEPESRPWWRVF